MSNVWREVSDNLIRALDSGSDDLRQSATLAYRLACELDEQAAANVAMDMELADMPPIDVEWNGLTAEPRVGDRVRVVAMDRDSGTVAYVYLSGACDARFPHTTGIYTHLARHEFEILPRDGSEGRI